MNNFRSVSDEILVGWCARSARNAGHAWFEFWERFSEMIYDFGRRRFNPRAVEPGDFYLYVRHRLTPRKFQTFDPTRGVFRFWFHRVLENLRVDFLRETSVRRSGGVLALDDDKLAAPVSDESASVERNADVEKELGHLDLKTRILCRLVVRPVSETPALGAPEALTRPEWDKPEAAAELQQLASLTGHPVEWILKSIIQIKEGVESRIQKIDEMEESLAVVLEHLHDPAVLPGRRLYLERRRDRLTRRMIASKNRVRPPLRQLADLLNEPVQTIATRLRRLRLRLDRGRQGA